MKDSNDRKRITATVRTDLAEWLHAKAVWQQRSMSSLVEDALQMLRVDMGEPGFVAQHRLDRLPEKARRNLERVRQRQVADLRSESAREGDSE